MISGLITIVLASELKHSTEFLLSGVVPAVCRDGTTKGTSQPDSAQQCGGADRVATNRHATNVELTSPPELPDRYAFGRKVVICLLLVLVILLPAVAAILISKERTAFICQSFKFYLFYSVFLTGVEFVLPMA